MKHHLAAIGLVGVLVGGVMNQINASAAPSPTVYRYIITETAGPTSLDPLDADNSQNLAVARMIYATPLEITPTNQLISGVLESFRYDSGKKTVEWIVKDGLKFSDGQPLTADDVAFAVARMARTRPSFPVIEEIVGVKSWANKPNALKTLPDGIIVNKNKISIRLAHDVQHPLFRFCLELFSIIPKSCVDLNSGKIKCADVPTSGYYAIAEKNQNSILFKKVEAGAIHGAEAPKEIRFEYNTTRDLAQGTIKADGKTVIAGNEQMFMPDEMRKIESAYTIRHMPAARFAALLLNPNTKPFQDQTCRRVFADSFRRVYADSIGRKAPAEASIFTKLIPGYLSPDVLDKHSNAPISESDRAKCSELFSNATVSWGYTEPEAHSTFVSTFSKTLKMLKIKSTGPLIAKDRAEMFEWFSNDKVAALSMSSGFWALDPSGDVKMLFTPNLHKILNFQSKDGHLQSMIDLLDKEEKQYAALNQHIYDAGLVNVYAHLRRFYASCETHLMQDVPFAISSPAPWQVFAVEK